jgi:F420H(2)-dependent quinone reductase
MKDRAVKRWSALHRIVYKVSGGRVGRRLVDNDMLLLTTTGRASGRSHTVPLLYLRDGDSLMVIASFGGRPHNPDWYLNLVANPSVRVQIGPTHREMSARTATAEERSSFWPRVVGAYGDYAVYQGRTEREIPLVILESFGA